MPSRVINDEIMIHDSEIGKVHFLNGPAAVIWDCCDGQTTFGECERRLRELFDVDPLLDLSKDIESAISDFRERGLVEAQQP